MCRFCKHLYVPTGSVCDHTCPCHSVGELACTRGWGFLELALMREGVHKGGSNRTGWGEGQVPSGQAHRLGRQPDGAGEGLSVGEGTRWGLVPDSRGEPDGRGEMERKLNVEVRGWKSRGRQAGRQMGGRAGEGQMGRQKDGWCGWAGRGVDRRADRQADRQTHKLGAPEGKKGLQGTRYSAAKGMSPRSPGACWAGGPGEQALAQEGSTDGRAPAGVCLGLPGCGAAGKLEPGARTWASREGPGSGT